MENTNAAPEQTIETLVETPEQIPSSEHLGDSDTNLSDIMRRLAIAEKAKNDAERALTLEKGAHAKLKKQHMTEAEALEERAKEIEAKAREYDKSMARVNASQLLVKAGLQEDEYSDLLNLFVSQDSEITGNIAQGIVDLVSKKVAVAVKAEREKIMKETPPPPSGNGGDQMDEFEKWFKKG